MNLDRTIPQILEQAADAHPDRPAIVDDTGALTFRALHARARAIAKAVVATGLEPGDRFAIWGAEHAGLGGGGARRPAGRWRAGAAEHTVQGRGSGGHRAPRRGTAGVCDGRISRRRLRGHPGTAGLPGPRTGGAPGYGGRAEVAGRVCRPGRRRIGGGTGYPNRGGAPHRSVRHPVHLRDNRGAPRGR